MERALVVFSKNKDGKTVNMFIDDVLIDEDIPYIPAKAVDHRGTALYFYGLDWDEYQLDELTEKPQEVLRAYNYMHHPELIRIAIEESNEQRKQQRRKFDFFRR